MHADIKQAHFALYAIDPGCGREEWHAIGRAAIASGLSIEDIDEWSKNAGNYSGSKDVYAAFKNVTPAGKTGPRTLFGKARDAGWAPSASAPSTKPAQGRNPAATAPRKPAPGMDPTEVYARCQPATTAHGYLEGKRAAGVPLDRLRVVPTGDPLCIAGESMAGALVVPVYRPDGSVSTLQLIPPPDVAARLKAKGKPGKLNLPGCPVQGWHTVGDMAPGGVVQVCEGIGQAWACWQATGAPAVVCFGWGRVRAVAEELRQRDPAAKLVLVPDVGKEQDADKVAADIGATVARMPPGWPQNSDVGDLAQREGLDALELLLAGASEPSQPVPLLTPVSVVDVLTNPSEPPRFAWDGYLPRGTVSLLSAHGGTAKSTVALMLTICTPLGRPLFGVDTVACKSALVSLEDGQRIVRHRAAHICRTWGIDPEKLRDRLFIVDGTENPELFTADSRSAGAMTDTYKELAELVLRENIGLVVIDNASDAFGGDEIQRRQVRAFMRSLAALARLTDCAVLLLAHVDKTTSRARKAEGGEGYSGSTAWHNSARSRLFMSRAEDGTLTLEHQKSNLGKQREPLTLVWPDGGLPMLNSDSGFSSRIQGRVDDDRAATLLRLIAEFESREQYCSPAPTSRNHVFAMLRGEPGFQSLKLKPDDAKRIVHQCQRAGWIAPLDYRDSNRKPHQRWTLTPDGRTFAGLLAPTAPTCANFKDCAPGTDGAEDGAPTAPSSIGGVGDRARTEVGAATPSLEQPS